MQGQARAPAAGTVLNALATGVGSAFAIDEYVQATVDLAPDVDGIEGEVAGDPDADTRLIETCVEYVLDEWEADVGGGTVRTESEVPMASGLKSSSAAANAAALATLDALGEADGHAEAVDREELARLGVRAARDVGVTVTGAFDDASASMLGGVTVTDNGEDELLAREEIDREVLVWTPPERAYSADADVDRCRSVAPMAHLVEDLALDGEYERAMAVNGLAFCAALEFDPEPIVEGLAHVDGVSLSGTGPSFTAVGSAEDLDLVRERWDDRPGETWRTTTQAEGARPL